MGTILDLRDKINRYFKFNPGEIRAITVTILVLAFAISFRDWGVGENINVQAGLFNFFNSILIVTLSLLVYHSTQRVMSIQTSL